MSCLLLKLGRAGGVHSGTVVGLTPSTHHDAASSPGWLEDAEFMSRSVPEIEHGEFVAVTRSLAETVEKGFLFGDRVVAEHLPRVLGAASEILAEHPVDEMGRCLACRYQQHNDFPWWPRRRTPCVVHDTFTYFFKGRRRFTDLNRTERGIHQAGERRT